MCKNDNLLNGKITWKFAYFVSSNRLKNTQGYGFQCADYRAGAGSSIRTIGLNGRIVVGCSVQAWFKSF
tara:strand:- start:347 stop:553 length:207 start_codon:yes stop_codon:yes gene_type:complete